MTKQFVVRGSSQGDFVWRMDDTCTGICCTSFADADYGPALIEAGEATEGDTIEFMSQTDPDKVLDTVTV